MEHAEYLIELAHKGLKKVGGIVDHQLDNLPRWAYIPIGYASILGGAIWLGIIIGSYIP